MLLLWALLLWSAISVHVIGGVALFRCWFPRESIWFGFVVPALALLALLNLVEHVVGLPSLLGLLPFTTIVCLWALLRMRRHWRHFVLPAGLFLAAFAFALTLRALRPDITSKRDGPSDLSLIASFCMGHTLPPPFILYPPVSLAHYYAFGHYGASVLTRLFALDVGTGFNLSVALVGALSCVLVAGIAWHVSGGKTWITILAAVLMECGGTGASAFLALTIPHLNPNDAGAALNEPSDQSPIWHWMDKTAWYDWPELFAPGVSNWIGAFHSNTACELLILLMGLALVVGLRRSRSNWPWICLGALPLFTIVTSTWALALEGPILLAALFWAWREKLHPRNLLFAGIVLTVLALLLLPDILEFRDTSAYPGGTWTQPESRTPLPMFALLWWPVYLPWIALLCIWPRLSPAVKTMAVVLPLFLLGMEFYSVGLRLDWTGKLWGYVYLLAWAVFVPCICAQRAYPFRVLVALLIYSGAVSLASWMGHAIRRIQWTSGEILQLQGSARIALDPQQGPILATLSRMKEQTIIPGKSNWLYVPAAVLAPFTGNSAYVPWSYFGDVLAGGNTHGGAHHREEEINALYDGKCGDPLLFLRSNKIAALVIYPDDDISTEVVDSLKAKLAPQYEYRDFTDGKKTTGIFVYRPLMAGWN